MKKKKLLSYMLAGFMLAGAVSNAPGNSFSVRAAGTYGYLPRTLSDTELKWSCKVNRNYKDGDYNTYINNPTQVVLLNGYVYIVSGGYLYKIKEGSVSGEVDPESLESVSGVGNGYNVFLSQGKSNGRDVLLVQNCGYSYSSVSAYYADDLKKAWECKDVASTSYGNSPLTFYDGYIYGNNGLDDFALNADTGSMVWKNTDNNPHSDYSAISNTAPAAVGNFVIYGDNGGYLKVYSAGADEDGKVNSQTKESENRIYSSIKYDNGYLYYLTCTYGKAPELHKTKFDEADGTLGVDSKVNINAVYTTSSPEIKDGKIYISGQKDKNDGSIFVYDENSLDLLASADTKGTGKLYDIKAVTDPADKDNTLIYTASYNQPGSVISSSFKDNKLMDAVSYQELTKGLADQYSDAQVTVGSDGTVYYSNDSGVLTAIAAKTETKAADYKITTVEPSYTYGSSEGLTIKSDGDFDQFQALYIDKKLVDKSNYTVKKGSTIVTLKDSFLNTLSAGDHIVEFKYKYGTTNPVTTTFHILPKKAATGTSVKAETINGASKNAGSKPNGRMKSDIRSPKTGVNLNKNAILMLALMLTLTAASGIFTLHSNAV